MLNVVRNTSIRNKLAWTSEKTIKRIGKRRSRTNPCPNDCLYCGTEVNIDKRRPVDGHGVVTDEFAETILGVCRKRADDWAMEVEGRIQYLRDLHANDTVYHQTCSCNFRSMRSVPRQFTPVSSEKRAKPGRPINENQEAAFKKVCQYLESQDEQQMTMRDLHSKLSEFNDDAQSATYSIKHLKRRLVEKFGDEIHVSGEGGLDDIVAMAESESKILRECYANRQSTEPDKKTIYSTCCFETADA